MERSGSFPDRGCDYLDNFVTILVPVFEMLYNQVKGD